MEHPRHKVSGPSNKLIKQNDVDGIAIGDWQIIATKKNIANSEELEVLHKTLNMKQLPEMVFGKSFLKVAHKSGYLLEFTAEDALKCIDPKSSANLPKVAYAKVWQQSKEQTLQETGLSPDLHKNVIEYDWTYTTTYKGTLPNTEGCKPEATSEKIDLEKLKRPDPILYYNEVHLFEDELADNGTADLAVKVRVMPSCFFILLRFWLRIDGVLFRVNDTRFYHEFGTNFLIREYQSKESSFQSVAQMLGPDPSKYLDSNVISPLLKTKETIVEKIELPKIQ